MLLWIAEALINFVSGSAITLHDIFTNLGGTVSIPVADLVSKALIIFTISVVLASLKLKDKEAFNLFLILCMLGLLKYFIFISSKEIIFLQLYIISKN